jgi:hypothetical protein
VDHGGRVFTGDRTPFIPCDQAGVFWRGSRRSHAYLPISLSGSACAELAIRSRYSKWRPAEKDRDGRANKPQRVSVASEKDADGRLLSMQVENEGDIEEATSETDGVAQQIAALVQRGESEITTAEIAAGVGREPQDSTFKRALGLAEERGHIAKVRRGIWAAGKAQAGLNV